MINSYTETSLLLLWKQIKNMPVDVGVHFRFPLKVKYITLSLDNCVVPSKIGRILRLEKRVDYSVNMVKHIHVKTSQQ